MTKRSASDLSRRRVLKAGAALPAVGLASSALASTAIARSAHVGGTDEKLRIALVGCGGRGTGAAHQALSTKGPIEIVAVADAFSDRAETSLKSMRETFEGKVTVTEDTTFIGFDACDKVFAMDEVDVVLLATPPHFRPEHFEKAVAAGKHVFMEKPVAVDGFGIKRVLAAAAKAKAAGQAVVCGLQRHHENGYVELMKRVHNGDLGKIVAARAYWNMGSLWHKPREAAWSDMEWQLRNWLYFTWLSGDHIVEQHVHNLDVVNWAMQGHPVRCQGLGGRQVRTDGAFGNIFDHHAVEYEYPEGARLFSFCRQIPGCANAVSEHLIGTEGNADTNRGYAITGNKAWRFEGEKNNPYQSEHDFLFESIRNGEAPNEGTYVAESTLTAIMGRMATYTGGVVTWEDALASERLGPETYDWGDVDVEKIPMPGTPWPGK